MWEHPHQPASNNPQEDDGVAAGADGSGTENSEWDALMQQWEVASSNWSAPANEEPAFYDRFLRSENPVIADAEEAGTSPRDRLAEWWSDDEAHAADRVEADEHRLEGEAAVAALAAEAYEAHAASLEVAGSETASSRGSWTTEPSRDAAESVSSLGSWTDFGGLQSSRAPEAAVAAGDGEEPELSSEDEAAVADQMLGVSQFGFVLATHGGGCTSTVQTCDTDLLVAVAAAVAALDTMTFAPATFVRQGSVEGGRLSKPRGLDTNKYRHALGAVSFVKIDKNADW